MTKGQEQVREKLAEAAEAATNLKDIFVKAEKLLDGDRTAASLIKDMGFVGEKLGRLIARVGKEGAATSPVESPAAPQPVTPEPAVSAELTARPEAPGVFKRLASIMATRVR